MIEHIKYKLKQTRVKFYEFKPKWNTDQYKRINLLVKCWRKWYQK